MSVLNLYPIYVLGLTLKTASRIASEKVAGNDLVNVDVRLCKECKATLFNHRDFKADVSRKPPEVKAYENLVQFERGIRLHLPKFQKLLTALQ